MSESWAGEFIGLVFGLIWSAPFIYHLRLQLTASPKTPLSRHCWLLWACGWFGIGIFFSFVPRVPMNTQIMDVPESPRTLGYTAFFASTLSQIVWALDYIPAADTASVRTNKLIKHLTPTLLLTIGSAVSIRLVHHYFIKSRPFYRSFLAFVAFFLILCSLGGSIIAPLELMSNQIVSGGREAGGLYWIPVVMQILALFATIFTTVIIYTNPEWYGAILLSLLLAADVLYIAVGVVKSKRQTAAYGRVA